MHTTRSVAASAVAALLLAACSDVPGTGLTADDPDLARGSARTSLAISPQPVGDIAPFLQNRMKKMNAGLAAGGQDVRVAVAEVMLAPEAPANMGTTILANDRTKRLPYFWVRDDPRRTSGGNTLTYLVDESWSYAYTRPSDPADDPVWTYLGDYFDTTFAPWAALPCGGLDLVRLDDTGAAPISFEDGSITGWFADITVGGWTILPAGVLGVTFTYWFVDENGNPTDIDDDGRADTALTEIWYNLGYYWIGDDPKAFDAVDLQSVAIHENGHALGAGHFGKLFITNKNGKLHFAPRAVMNAAYVEPLQSLRGTDKASFCGNFASW